VCVARVCMCVHKLIGATQAYKHLLQQRVKKGGEGTCLHIDKCGRLGIY